MAALMRARDVAEVDHGARVGPRQSQCATRGCHLGKSSFTRRVCVQKVHEQQGEIPFRTAV